MDINQSLEGNMIYGFTVEVNGQNVLFLRISPVWQEGDKFL
jgi:hypothetical protein